MDTVRAGQLLHVTILGEQSHGRSGLAHQHAFEIFGQRETGPLHLGGRGLVAKLRLLDEFLYGRFHAPQYVGGCAQAHHLERTDRLVQLLARDAQMAAIHRRHVRTTRKRRVANEAPQRSGSRVEGLAQLVQHPSQRAQVIGCDIDIGCCFHYSPVLCQCGGHCEIGLAGPLVAPP